MKIFSQLLVVALLSGLVLVPGVQGADFVLEKLEKKECSPCRIREIISKHIRLLANHNQDCSHLCLPENVFSDDRTKGMIRDICRTCSLKPLLDFWTNHMPEIVGDAALTQECGILLFMIYQGLITNKTRSLPWFSLIGLYMQLNAIPLVKLFDILDDCLQQYQAIFVDYGGNLPDAANLHAWLMDYWWLPTLVAATAMVSFARWYKSRPQKEPSREPIK